MAYSELPKLKKNSVSTTIASPGINDTDTTIPVTELAVFYDSDSNLITKGIVIGYDNATETYAEEITITGASGTSGAGNLTGATRGVNADGTNGAAKAHIATTNIAVMFSTGIYENIRDNQIDHEISIGAIEAELPSKATKTTATQSIYVDKAATGAGDGISWTDAFTTIQAAVESLPTVLEHDVTIYVRKGTTAYDENISIMQITGKGSLIVRGEYYWYGGCAAAGTPSTTKFNLTATDGAQIAAGDPVLVRDGFADYIYSTVVATVDKGSDVWEIEINDALPTGNIGTDDYYTICKTKIITTTGVPINSSYINMISVYGLYLESGNSRAISHISSNMYLYGCMLIGYTTNGAILIQGCGDIGIYNCYLYTSTTGRIVWVSGEGIKTLIGSLATGADGSVFVSGGNAFGGVYLQAGTCFVYGGIFDVSAGVGVRAMSNTYASINYSTISPSGRAAAGTGLYSSENTAIGNSKVTNNATIPKNPASSTDGAYIA